MTSCRVEDGGDNKNTSMVREATQEDDESSDEEDEESNVQFAKCRAGVQLFREMSVISRAPDTIRPKSGPDLDCQEDIAKMSDLLSVMARMRLDDQRCALGVSSTKTSQNIPETNNIQGGSSKERPAVSSKKCKETLFELLDKRPPLHQVLLIPSSQWKLHHDEEDDISVKSLTPSLQR